MTASPSPPAVRTAGLTKRFGDTRAVDGLDLTVPRGCVYGFLGPNGAGKTTTLRMLATLLRPDAGTATVLGHDVSAEPARVRARIGLTGQFAALDDDLTALENLTVLARLLGHGRRAARDRARDLLDAFDLADRAGHLVKTFSGGMRRRLDVAASLIVTPELLFLDEPTTGLDPAGRTRVWDVIAMLPGQGTTVLLTTQYLDEADRLADHLAVIDHGRLIAEGTPGRLRAATGSGALHVRLDDPSRRDDAVRLVDRPAVAASDPAALTFAGVRTQEANAIVTELLAGGIALAGFSLDRPSLEEAFLALTAPTAEPDLRSS